MTDVRVNTTIVVVIYYCDFIKARTMISICDIAELISGTPQFRITEDLSGSAPMYFFYSQSDLEDDLSRVSKQNIARKQIRTLDEVITTCAGDVVFSLLSGKAAIVQAEHSGLLLTQNYVRLVPLDTLNADYLVYLLNEDQSIRYQLHISQQGSITMKYTLKQLRELIFPALPSLEKQRLIGEIYLSQLKLNTLRKRVAELETVLVLGKIKEAVQL